MELTLEDYMRDKLSKEMAQSIDFDILCDTLVPFGWTVVEVEYGPGKEWIDVMAWFDGNCVGDYKEWQGKWLFKNEKDAIMFKLKWA